jgi:penicillin amidase
MRRLLLNILGVIATLVALTVLAAYGYLRRSLPQLDGTISVAGISAPVDIVRDADAITHIFASTKLDAFYGLGYAHAQDRLWQMEFQRRVGHGRLSEIFGAATVPTDRFLRTLGTGRAARAAWDALPRDARAGLEAYVTGVNSFIATHHGSALPPEFTLLRFEPEPWSGPDVVAWVKMMAWDLSKNYSFELLRHDLLLKVGAQKTADLLMPYAENGLNILSAADMPWLSKANVAQALRPAGVGGPADGRGPGPHHDGNLWSGAFGSTAVPGVGDALGSNNWVVDGTMTASGKPLLANDPHLGAQIPSLWYLAHLSAGDFDVIGATLPGAPAIAIGRNRYIAWGETNVMADVEDLYRERIDPTGRFVEFQGAQEPLRLVSETIVVKGAQPIQLSVRISRHGPLISDAINANNAESTQVSKPAPLEPLAFRWTALDPDDTTVDSFLHLNEARNWNEFTAALRNFVVPAQNFVYADVDGHIGYYAPGRFPIRASGDGSIAAPGWSGLAEWTGWVPFDELPHTYDPPEHFIVTANDRPVQATYPHPLSGEWTEPYRAERIVDLLRQKSRLTPDDFAAIQADTYSLHAQAFLPALLARVHPRNAQAEQAVTMLRQWNRDERGDSAAAAIFQAWYYALVPTIAGDELGPQLTANYQELDRHSYVSRFLMQTLATADISWCDDVRTPARETCDEATSAALDAGIARLTKALGGDMARWRWDAAHKAVFAHSTLDTVPGVGWFLRRSVPHGGDWSTVNVGPVFAPRPFELHSLSGYRQIVDLSPSSDSRFLDAVGQSGHPLSAHYDDALPDWGAVRHRKMRMERAEIEQGAIGHLRLTPR